MPKCPIAAPVLMTLAITSAFVLVHAPATPATPSAAGSQPPSARAEQPVQLLHVPRMRRGGEEATNWSGYALDGPAGTFTGVTGSWVVPMVNVANSCSGSYSAAWVGIDGDNSNSVEQCGTEQDGSGQYYAWYEMYPHVGYYVTRPGDGRVLPGDMITATVQYVGRGSFTLTMASTNKAWQTSFRKTGGVFTTTQKLPSAQRSSVEWIMEAPWSGGVLPLANFGTIDFTGCQFSPALPSAPQPITMVDSSYAPGDDLASHAKAMPGAWNSGSFSVMYLKCQ